YEILESIICSVESFLFFFFQAEDGIRDYKVTGVQTCALPISKMLGRFRWAQPGPGFGPWPMSTQTQVGVVWRAPTPLRKPDDTRSEERRVGKECRSGRWK